MHTGVESSLWLPGDRSANYRSADPYNFRTFPYHRAIPAFDPDSAIYELLRPDDPDEIWHANWLDEGAADGGMLQMLEVFGLEGVKLGVEPNKIGKNKLPPAKMTPEELVYHLGNLAAGGQSVLEVPAYFPVTDLNELAREDMSYSSTPAIMVKGDARNLRFIKDKAIDIATCRLMMYEIPIEEHYKVYNELLRVLADDGIAVFTTNDLSSREHMRSLEQLTAYYLGVKPGERMRVGWPTYVAKEKLPNIFADVHFLHYYGEIHAQWDSDIEEWLNVIESLWDRFDPRPDPIALRRVLDTKIRSHLEKHIKRKGAYVDRVARTFAVAGKQPLDGEKIRRRGEGLGLTYEHLTAC